MDSKPYLTLTLGDDNEHVVGEPDTYFGVCQLPLEHFEGHGGTLPLPKAGIVRSSEGDGPLCRRLDIKVSH